jgi:hypothetical protein
MKLRTQKPLGALHPVLFFSGIYLVALVFSIFICSVIFYSCNARGINGFAGKAGESKPAAQIEKRAETMIFASR